MNWHWPDKDDRSIVKMLQDQQSHAWQACRDFFLKKYVKKGYPESAKEDVVQNALIKVYHSLKDFSFKSSLVVWLGTILSTTVIDFARKERNRDANVSLNALQDADEKGWEAAVETRTLEDHCLTRETIVEAVTGYREWLKKKSRKNAERDYDLWSRYVQGQSIGQIAHDRQMKEDTVRHALRKAKQYFSQLHPED